MTDKTQDAWVRLAAALDIRAVRPLYNELKEMRGADIRVDASEVSLVGAQCLQVLVSAVASWKADGCEIDFVEPSAAFIDGVDRLGVPFDALAIS